MNLVKKHVKIKLMTELLGTVPMNKEVYTTYIESLRPIVDGEPEAETVEEREERGWTGFHKDKDGLFVYDYFIKGFFKNAGNVLKDELKIKNLRSKLSDLFFVMPRKIRLGKEKADGTLERPLRAQTAQGPRVTLAKSDFIAAGTEIEFDIVLLQGKGELKEDIVEDLLAYGQLQGLGQFRNGGYGRFTILSVS